MALNLAAFRLREGIMQPGPSTPLGIPPEPRANRKLFRARSPVRWSELSSKVAWVLISANAVY